MTAKSITDVMLECLVDIGIKKRTIANNYACFYRALCKEDGGKDLDRSLVSSFLNRRYGKDILSLPNHQLSRREQTSKHAFNVLLDYRGSKALPARLCPASSISEHDLEVLDTYLRFCAEAGNVDRTIQRKRDSIKRFLLAGELCTITPLTIQTYLRGFMGRSAYYQKKEMDEVKSFLAYCTRQGTIEKDFSRVIPNIKAVKDSKIPSVFTDNEVKELLLHFSARDSINRLRDYAMVLLMVVYGFRSIDISHLHIRCIDFDNGTIMFAQSKTGIAVRHEILPHVGNVLADYILNERNNSSSPLLFLKSGGDSLSSKTVSGVVRNGFLRSGINIGMRKYGSHSLRHSIGSSLINDGYSIFTVANILGQTSAATARLYAKVDLLRLSACALEVPANE
jgi:site-specific recombinase XerD